MPTSHAELIARARKLGRAENDDRARRWLAATCSILADWGGDSAKSILKESLPSQCLSGKGSSGRSFEKALAEAGGAPGLALQQEAEHRTHQPDPRNVAMMLRPLLGLVKAEVAATKGAQGVETLITSLPAGIQDEVREANTAAPYAFSLLPQSYERPRRH